MLDFLSAHYFWVKAFHVISVICWMAGLLYLPRLYVYHANLTEKDSLFYETLITMERRLLKGIMLPSFILTAVFGGLLVVTPGVWQKGMYWLHLKFFLVFLMGVGHLFMIQWYFEFKNKTSYRSSAFFRVVNEVPALLMIGIVILAVVKPF